MSNSESQATKKAQILEKLMTLTPATRKAVLMAAEELREEQRQERKETEETDNQENQQVHSSNKS